MRTVTLADGREVDSASPEYADECLARHVARKQAKDRQAWLAAWKARHGDASTQRLLAKMAEVRRAAR